MSEKGCETCAYVATLPWNAPCQGCLGFSSWTRNANAPSGVEAEVCADIARRQALGVQKYGTTVADNPLTHEQWLQHAYEEALDLAIYLKRAMRK